MKSHSRNNAARKSRPARQQPAHAPSLWVRLLIAGLLLLGVGVAGYKLVNRHSSGPVPPPVTISDVQPVKPIASDTLPSSEADRAPATNNPAPAQAGTPAEQAAALINEGNDLIAEGHLEDGMAKYQGALKLNPEDEEIHFNLGYAWGRLRNYEQAILHYQRALEIFPDYVEAHNNLGNIYMRVQRLDDAIAEFKAALKILPEHVSALNNLGMAYASQQKFTNALAYFKDAVRLNPDHIDSRFNLGNTLLSLNQPQAAIAEYSEVLKRQPDFEMAAKQLARAKAKLAGGPVAPPLMPGGTNAPRP